MKSTGQGAGGRGAGVGVGETGAGVGVAAGVGVGVQAMHVWLIILPHVQETGLQACSTQANSSKHSESAQHWYRVIVWFAISPQPVSFWQAEFTQAESPGQFESEVQPMQAWFAHREPAGQSESAQH